MFTDLNPALQQEEDARLLAAAEEYEIDSYSCVDNNETTLWLKYTQWPARLANRLLDLLAATVLQPAVSVDNYLFEDWAGADIISLAAHEARLRADACHRPDVRLRNRDLRPDAPLPSLLAQYLPGLLPPYPISAKRFLCYVFRVWAADETLQRDVYSAEFRPEETGQIAYVWWLLSDLEEPSDKSSSTDDNKSYTDSDNNDYSDNESYADQQDGAELRIAEAVLQLFIPWTGRKYHNASRGFEPG